MGRRRFTSDEIEKAVAACSPPRNKDFSSRSSWQAGQEQWLQKWRPQQVAALASSNRGRRREWQEVLKMHKKLLAAAKNQRRELLPTGALAQMLARRSLSSSSRPAALKHTAAWCRAADL
jgi:hypothetical protein